MPCENYKDALIEAAASGATPQGRLREHLAACASCRSAFDEEQYLFAAIDSGLHGVANAETPPSLLPRVRTQLDDQRVLGHSWLLVWSALAAATVLVVATMLIRNLNHANVRPNSAQSPDARGVPGEEFPSVAMTHPGETVDRLSKKRLPRTVDLLSAKQVYVLIPPGQKQAVDVLLAGLQQGDLKHESLFEEKSEQPLRDLEVPPLGVLPMEVKPLADVSSDASSESENARP